MNDEQHRPTLAEILASDPIPRSDHDPLGHWAKLTPRALAILNLRDCDEQLARAEEQPLRIAQAAKSAHLAMQAALIEALAGSVNVGAYDEKLRAQYLAYLDESRDGKARRPRRDHVMRFDDLLARAMEHPMEWSGRCLEVSADELTALNRLKFVRDRVEHPRPDVHCIEPLFIALTLPVAARLTLDLLDVCNHRYKKDERTLVAATVASITARCAAIE